MRSLVLESRRTMWCVEIASVRVNKEEGCGRSFPKALAWKGVKVCPLYVM